MPGEDDTDHEEDAEPPDEGAGAGTDEEPEAAEETEDESEAEEVEDESGSDSDVTTVDAVTGEAATEADAADAGETEVESEVDEDLAGSDASTGSKDEEDLEREILDPEERMGPGQKFCHNCGEAIDESAEICPECGVRQDLGDQSTGASGDQKKEPGIAAVLSLIIPGAGQVYNEQLTRGLLAFGGVLVIDVVAFIVLFVVGIFLGILTFGLGGLIVFLAPVIHVVLAAIAAWDAYDQARKINAGQVAVE